MKSKNKALGAEDWEVNVQEVAVNIDVFLYIAI